MSGFGGKSLHPFVVGSVGRKTDGAVKPPQLPDDGDGCKIPEGGEPIPESCGAGGGSIGTQIVGLPIPVSTGVGTLGGDVGLMDGNVGVITGIADGAAGARLGVCPLKNVGRSVGSDVSSERVGRDVTGAADGPLVVGAVSQVLEDGRTPIRVRN
jgi:hypothetical protein